MVTVLTAGQAQVDDAPEGHNANQTTGHAPRENSNDPTFRTTAGSDVLRSGWKAYGSWGQESKRPRRA